MLADIVAIQHDHLEALAHDWLAAGATAFCIWNPQDELLARWPLLANGTTNCVTPSLTASIRVGNLTIGALGVLGLDTERAKVRLQAEANLLSQLAHLERDLNSMAAELIDTRDQLLALYNLTEATRHYVGIDETLERLAYETAKLVKAESAFLIVDLPQRPRLKAYYPSKMLDDETLTSCLGMMQASKQPFLSTRDTVSDDPPYRSLLLVPMQVRQSKTAVLGVMNKLGDDFMSPDVKMAKAIADYAGAQIENVLLFQASVEQTKLQTEMELAQQVQLHLLPRKPPHVAGLDLWAATKPASQVGGDFYDFIVTSDQPFAFAIGDISGKGMPAALLMAMTRTVLRTKLNAVPMPSPEDIIGLSNEELYDDFTEVSMFATVCLGQYFSETQTLVYANAGHSPVIYCPAQGKAALLEADGTAMGILPVSFSRNQTIQLHPGDVFLLGTDGLNEATNEQNEMFGCERLLALVAMLADKSAEEIAHGIYTAVREFGTGELQDDQTLLILKCVH